MNDELIAYLLNSFKNSGEFHRWLVTYVWPRYRVRKRYNRPTVKDGLMITAQARNVLLADQERRLAAQPAPLQDVIDYLLATFPDRAALHWALIDHVWPRFKHHPADGDTINEGAVDLDGTRLRTSEVTRRAAEGEPVRIVRTGLISIWNQKQKRWMPLENQNDT